MTLLLKSNVPSHFLKFQRDRSTHGEVHSRTDRQTDKQTDRQIYRETGRSRFCLFVLFCFVFVLFCFVFICFFVLFFLKSYRYMTILGHFGHIFGGVLKIISDLVGDFTKKNGDQDGRRTLAVNPFGSVYTRNRPIRIIRFFISNRNMKCSIEK